MDCLVVVYTSDIDNSAVGVDHFCIISDDASISSSIDKWASVATGYVIRHIVGYDSVGFEDR